MSQGQIGTNVEPDPTISTLLPATRTIPKVTEEQLQRWQSHPTSDQARSPLLRLSLEVRYLIYGYVLGGQEIFPLATRAGLGLQTDLPGMALLFTCQQVYAETWLLPFRLNMFIAPTQAPRFEWWMLHIGAQRRQAITTVVFDWSHTYIEDPDSCAQTFCYWHYKSPRFNTHEATIGCTPYFRLRNLSGKEMVIRHPVFDNYWINDWENARRLKIDVQIVDEAPWVHDCRCNLQWSLPPSPSQSQP